MSLADAAQIASEYNGIYERLYILRDRYEAAVQAAGPGAAVRRANHQVQATGLRLARAQRSAIQALQDDRRIAARSGVALDPATKNPETSADFLGLILREQRAQTTAAQEQAAAMSSVGSPLQRTSIDANSHAKIATTQQRERRHHLVIARLAALAAIGRPNFTVAQAEEEDELDEELEDLENW